MKGGYLLRWGVAAVGCVVGSALAAWLVLWVSLRSSAVKVPNVQGMDGPHAFTILHENGLLAREQEGVFDARVPVGRIARQRPSAGLEVKRSTVVLLFPSQGSAAQDVRDLTGLPLSLAEAELEADGLRAGRQCRIDEQADAVIVVAHVPPAGARVAPNSEVALLVNAVPRRKRYVMPDFVGIDETIAARVIRALGFRLADLQQVPYPALRSGVVLRQDPLAGGPVSEAAVVGLWVSR